MTDPELADTLRILRDPQHDVRNASATLTAALRVSGASISTLGEFLDAETVSASDVLAAQIDELQFDLGEGPSWEALQHRAPVLAADLPNEHVRWPAFAPAAMEHGIASVFAFPLFIGPLRFGAIDLYSTTPVVLDEHEQEQAAAMATVLSRRVLHRALSATDDDAADDANPYSRRLVHQATGMVLAQLDVSPEDARLVIQGHAYATERTMMEVAQQLIDRSLHFTHTESGIEER